MQERSFREMPPDEWVKALNELAGPPPPPEDYDLRSKILGGEALYGAIAKAAQNGSGQTVGLEGGVDAWPVKADDDIAADVNHGNTPLT